MKRKSLKGCCGGPLNLGGNPQGTFVTPSRQGYNQSRSVRKSQSGSVRRK